MNNLVIVNQGGGKYLFSAPENITLKKGDKVKCDTRRGVTDGTVWADSLFADDETMQLIGKLTGAKFPLKSVVGKEVTAVEMFEKPQQEDKPTYKPGDKVKVIGNTCSHGYPIGEILTLAECVMRNCRPAWNVAESDIWYIREADIEPYTEPKPEYYSGEVVCTESDGYFTVGKVYEFVDGKIKDDDGDIRPHCSIKISSLADAYMQNWQNKFIEFIGE